MPESNKRSKIYEPEELSASVKRPRQLLISQSSEAPKYDKVILVVLYNADGESEKSAESLKINAQYLEQKWRKTYHESKIDIVHYDIANDHICDEYLLNATSETKVIISGHGCKETNKVAGRDPEWLAEIIYDDLEITEAKSITLLSCNMGQTTFCTELKSELSTKSDGLFFPDIYAYTLPILVFGDGSRIADKGESEDPDSEELEFVPARLHKKRF